MLSKLLNFLSSHKIMVVIGIFLFLGAGYFGYRQFHTQEETVRYLTSTAEKGMLISSITGTGQVFSSNQVDIKSTVSGEVLQINVEGGEKITSSTVIAFIDDSDSQKELRDARNAYEDARIDLNELLDPPEELDIAKAESALDAAKRDLEELINPSEDTLYTAETALLTAKESLSKLKYDQAKTYKTALENKDDAENDLVDSYNDSLNLLTTVFFDLPTIITDLYDILYSTDITDNETALVSQTNAKALINTVDFETDEKDVIADIKKLVADAKDNYAQARKYYDENFEDYRTLSNYSDHDEIETVLSETVTTVKAMAETVKTQTNMLDYWVDYYTQIGERPFSTVTAYQTDLQGHTSKLNSLSSSLLSQQRALEDTKKAIVDANETIAELENDQPIDLAAAERTVKEKKDSLEKINNPEQYDINDLEISVREKEKALEDLKTGADENDIRSQRIAVQDKYDALVEAREQASEHYVKTPFDGIIASVDIALGDTVNSGTVIGTVITEQKIVEVTLNEIDIASIEVGQNTTISFDAVPDLTVTGKVIEVDTIGTINKGVVSYNVKIAFDVQDERVKPGMSTSVSIITSSKQDVLLVPLGAIKTSGNMSYVEVLVNGQPQNKTVTTGESNDTMIEIIDGLSEGDQVITQTISNTTASTKNGSSSGSSNGDHNPGVMRMLR